MSIHGGDTHECSFHFHERQPLKPSPDPFEFMHPQDIADIIKK